MKQGFSVLFKFMKLTYVAFSNNVPSPCILKCFNPYLTLQCASFKECIFSNSKTISNTSHGTTVVFVCLLLNVGHLCETGMLIPTTDPSIEQ